jgi:aspartyl-tRNA(Asn)/glutamyl-tRNA(Gln) amidotransferase subunit A
MNHSDLSYASAKKLSTMLKQGDVSALELTSHFLDRIRQLDGPLNSLITVSEEHAITAAKAADKALSDGTATPLTGIPSAA